MKFIGYIPYGYPNLEKSLHSIELYIEAGCEAFELSFPRYDAPGESPMIVDFMNKALDNCSDFDKYMDGVRDLRNRHEEIEINLLIFMDTIQSIGMGKFVEFCHEVNINALICPHSKEYETEKQWLRDHGISFFTSFGYGGTDEDLQNCLKPNQVIYMTAFCPAWQEYKRDDFNRPKDIVDFLRSHGVTNPIYAGVGIKTLENAVEVKEAGADGFFVGATIMSLIGKDEEQLEMVKKFIEAGK